MRAVVCVDVGSTFTKASLVDLVTARLVATAEHRTTIDTDVMDGVDACVAQLTEADPRAAEAPVLACSSAGGGLRIAVVGGEELVTAEAGRRVALSSGGKVVSVTAAARAGSPIELSALAEPDVVLLTGGTDGGNAEVVVAAARGLVAAGWRGPVVVAANVDAVPEVVAALDGVPHVVADNVVPRIGVLRPDGARAAVREVFLAHVIGGKELSSRADFVAMVRGATPDVVLTGVEVLAAEVGDVVVVDVGGATTDVHSVVELEAEDREASGLARDVVAPTTVTRTVEGDLGMRWSAVTTVAAGEEPGLRDAAARRAGDPAYLPGTDAERDDDEAIARVAAGLALRRHAGRSRVVTGPDGRVVERSGRDLRQVRMLVASGGVVRHGRPGVAERVLGASIGEAAASDGGWQLPTAAQVVVDRDYVLAAVGLLAASHPQVSRALARGLVG